MNNNTPIIYTMSNLEDTREFMQHYNYPVILTNSQGCIRYFGMRVLDYMFKQLMAEFSQITKVIANVDDDHAGLLTAIKLDYKNIVYTGNSKEARRVLDGWLSTRQPSL